jgi:glycosyltransferase involved in cell wall biosynthesis
MEREHKKASLTPLVSVSCATYNHENYIRDSLEGFLIQKTTFPIEILIHDDASTDGTADIIKEYEKKHPDLIFPIYQKENQYSKGLTISSTFNWPRARGKYIALCEGDDYWTDPYKLQKQVEFLEATANAAGVGCYYNIMEHKGNNQVFKPLGKVPMFVRYNFNDMLTKRIPGVRTLTMIYRADAVTSEYVNKTFALNSKAAGDVLLVSNILKYNGDIYLLPFFGAVYRKHEKGESAGLKSSKAIRQQNFHNYEGIMNLVLVKRDEKLKFWLRNLKNTLRSDVGHFRIMQMIKDFILIFN